MSLQKTSITAYGVAYGLVKLAEMPRWKTAIPEEMLQLSAAFVERAKDSLLKRLIRYLPPELYIRILDIILVPGMVQHFLFRKEFIERQVTQFIQKGGSQVLVLGGGFDTLVLRMAKLNAAVSFFEIDLPNTQRTKIRILKDIAFGIPQNCFFVEADLSKVTVGEALSSQKQFTPDAPTMVVIEGVLMYLPEGDVKALFGNMRETFNNALTVVFGSIVASDDEGRWLLRITNTILGRGQEGTKWFCSHSDVPKFMSSLGYVLQESVTYKALQRPYRSEAEILDVPEEDENYYIVTKMHGT